MTQFFGCTDWLVVMNKGYSNESRYSCDSQNDCDRVITYYWLNYETFDIYHKGKHYAHEEHEL